MSGTRRVFPESFKREAVDRVVTSGLGAGGRLPRLAGNETLALPSGRKLMHRILSLIATAAVALSLAGTANAASCKDPATGKFIKCPAASASTATGGYTLDAKGNCHDARGKMAKKSMCAGQTASATTSTTTAPNTAGGATTTTTTTASSSTGGPHCTKGKRCGNACISVKDVCHKQP